MGPGLVLFMLTLLLQAVNAQSRQMLNYVPFVVAFTALAWDRDIKRLDVRVFAAVCFVYSKIWFPINLVPLKGPPRQWPMQRYFMSHGPWMNAEMYIVQGAVVLLTFLYLPRLFSRPASRAEELSPRR
jgi:hypothetical protein